jgi:hypothetical protein
MFMSWRDPVMRAALLRPDLWSDAAVARAWGLLCWLDRPHADAPRFRAPFQLLLLARQRGIATDADVIDALLGEGGRGTYQFGARGLDDVTRRRPTAEITQVPGLIELANRVRERILDVETARGDLVTPLSQAALRLRSVPGPAATKTFIETSSGGCPRVRNGADTLFGPSRSPQATGWEPRIRSGAYHSANVCSISSVWWTTAEACASSG